MAAPAFTATVEYLAGRLAAEHTTVATQWLLRLDELIDINTRDIFPSDRLLDHIPELVHEIAAYVNAPADQEILANTVVMAKAKELGLMRFEQRASVHQLLREYALLGEVIGTFLAAEAAKLGETGDVTAAVVVATRALRAVQVFEGATVDAFVAKHSDATDRQTAQLRDFSRLIGHEIRQPLGVLQVIAHLIATPVDGAEAAKMLETLERNVVRLGDVAQKLERLARLTQPAQSGAGDTFVELATIADDVAKQLAEMAAARNVTIEIAPPLPKLAVDAGRLELVLINLLANAVKYSDPAKPARVVRVHADGSVPRPRVHITDNGIGIPKSQLDMIFEQFVRVHVHLDGTLGAQGMGLGLAIVRECMGAMNGSVTVESTEGIGTTFTLEWPVAVASLL